MRAGKAREKKSTEPAKKRFLVSDGNEGKNKKLSCVRNRHRSQLAATPRSEYIGLHLIFSLATSIQYV